jgi:hypothetical protein
MAIDGRETMKVLIVMPGNIVGAIVARQIVARCPKGTFQKNRMGVFGQNYNLNKNKFLSYRKKKVLRHLIKISVTVY